MPVIPAPWETEARGLLEFKTSLGNMVKPSVYKKIYIYTHTHTHTKISRVWWHVPVVPWHRLLGRLRWEDCLSLRS